MSVCVLVAGMHRSGTSAAAGLLRAAGVDMGSDFLPAQPDSNAAGFWEDRWVVEFHERVLDALGVTWDHPADLPERWEISEAAAGFREEIRKWVESRAAAGQVWGLKDPRLCRLAPLWRAALEDCGCRRLWIVVFRHPVEVALSLKRRDGFSFEKSGALWVLHHLGAGRHLAGERTLHLAYEQMLSDPCGRLLRWASDWLPAAAAEDDVQRRMRESVKAQLRHHRASHESGYRAFGRFGFLVQRLHARLRSAARGGPGEALEDVDLLSDDMGRIAGAYDPLLTEHMRSVLQRAAAAKREAAEARGWAAECEAWGREAESWAGELERMRGADAQRARTAEARLGGRLERAREERERERRARLNAERALRGMQASRSWRMTAPLRRLHAKMRGVRPGHSAPGGRAGEAQA